MPPGASRRRRLALFLWTAAGGLVVDHLMARIDLDGTDPERLQRRTSRNPRLAGDFMMSRTHLQRLLCQGGAARLCRLVRRAEARRELWISRDFVHEYCAWQAVKFAYVDEAFHMGEGTDREYAVDQGRSAEAERDRRDFA